MRRYTAYEFQHSRIEIHFCIFKIAFLKPKYNRVEWQMSDMNTSENKLQLIILGIWQNKIIIWQIHGAQRYGISRAELFLVGNEVTLINESLSRDYSVSHSSLSSLLPPWRANLENLPLYRLLCTIWTIRSTTTKRKRSDCLQFNTRSTFSIKTLKCKTTQQNGAEGGFWHTSVFCFCFVFTVKCLSLNSDMFSLQMLGIPI